MTAKLNLLATLGALILFTLPWLEIQCSQRPMITQTGLQTITGSGTLAPEFRDEDNDKKLQDDKDKPAPAILVGVALAFTILAFILAAASAFGKKNRDRAVGLACAVAVACLLTQVIIGFPVERGIADSVNAKKSEGTSKEKLPELFGKALVDLRVERRDPLYIQLFVLGLPVLLLLNTLIDKRQKDQVS